MKKSKLQGEREITIGILGYSSLVKFEKFDFHFGTVWKKHWHPAKLTLGWKVVMEVLHKH